MGEGDGTHHAPASSSWGYRAAPRNHGRRSIGPDGPKRLLSSPSFITTSTSSRRPTKSVSRRSTAGGAPSSTRSSGSIFNAAFSWAGTPSQTTYNSCGAVDRVTITRPHHPLHGQTLEVTWGARGRGSKGRLTVVLPDGYCAIVPREWTDLDGGASQHRNDSSCVFTIDAVRQLITVFEALRSRP